MKFPSAGLIQTTLCHNDYQLCFCVNPKNIKFTLEDGFENLKKLKNFKKPLLIIHAELDDIVPFSQADLMILESGSEIKDLFKVNAAGHNNVIAIAREHYFIKIRDFIQYNNK